MEKQAVLLIHGIGEQKPMTTLRSFVETVWVRNTDAHNPNIQDPGKAWSKPDSVSENFELRRLTTARNKSGQRTDFFEFYWAHLMSGTDLSHVFGWFRFLLIRNPFKLPPKLVGIYWLLVAALLVSGALITNEVLQFIELPRTLSFVLGVVFVPLLNVALKQFLGDAARYLYPAPVNVQRRHAIRTAGVDLLKKLHERGYRRIIVVGHSLGTVIGYDILTHAFADFNTQHGSPPSPQSVALEELEAIILSGDYKNPDHIDRFQEAQHHYFQELRNNGNSWSVTDFITLGSPLTHADVLMAASSNDLTLRQANRELPTCPPILEETTKDNQSLKRFTYRRKYQIGGKNHRIHVPHHAAVFAATRWSNLYFPSKWILIGDFVAGPLRTLFGDGIRDVAVRTAQRKGLLSHTLYWRENPGTVEVEAHVQALRDLINLVEIQQDDQDPTETIS